MKKVKFIIPIFILFLSGCSSDLSQENLNKSNYESEKLKKKIQGDGKHDLLGWGYDPTVGYLDPAAYNKLQVIDVDRLKAEQPGDFYYGQPNASMATIIAGNDAVDWSLDLSSKFSGSATIKVLTATMKLDLVSNFLVTSKYSYATYYKTISLQREKLYHTMDVLKNYLTPTFTNSINTLTPNDILIKYGTHVYTDITIGGKLEVNYRSFTNSDLKKIVVNSGVSAVIDKVFSLTADNSVGFTYKSSNLDVKSTFRTIGGNPAQALSGDITDGTASQKINFDAWSSTVNLSNSEIVDIGNTSLIPIYEFVSDPVKKEALKTAVDNYISSWSVKLMNVKPIYRYCYKGNHLYTIDWNEKGAGSTSSNTGWYYEGIAYFIPESEQPDTKAFNRYARTYAGPLYDHFYTTDSRASVSSSYSYEGMLGYIYEWVQKPNTVPLYQYYKSSTKDHFYTTDMTEGYGYSLEESTRYFVIPGIKRQ